MMPPQGRKRLADWWLAPAPAERLVALRVLIGGFALSYVGLRMPELVGSARLPTIDFAPIGITRVLSAPLSPALAITIALATCVLLIGFIAGFRYRVIAPLAACALLWTLTYRSSWGQVFHTENLLVLHVIVLALSPGASGDKSNEACGWPIKLLVAVTVATYFVAGVAKLRIAGLAWLDGDLLRDQVAVDNLRKLLLGHHVAPLARPMLAHPAAFAILSVATLAIELGSPLVFLGGRVSRIWVYAAWGFHVGVALVMSITFPYPLLGFAFLPMFRVERLFRRDLRRTGMSAAP
jgi:hypothetical protein